MTCFILSLSLFRNFLNSNISEGQLLLIALPFRAFLFHIRLMISSFIHGDFLCRVLEHFKGACLFTSFWNFPFQEFNIAFGLFVFSKFSNFAAFMSFRKLSRLKFLNDLLSTVLCLFLATEFSFLTAIMS